MFNFRLLICVFVQFYQRKYLNFSINFSKTKGHALKSFWSCSIVGLKYRTHVQPTRSRFSSFCHLLVACNFFLTIHILRWYFHFIFFGSNRYVNNAVIIVNKEDYIDLIMLMFFSDENKNLFETKGNIIFMINHFSLSDSVNN